MLQQGERHTCTTSCPTRLIGSKYTTKSRSQFLKQQLEARRNNVTSLAHHDPSVRRLAFADNLYHAEVKAYAPAVISKSFKDVGLYPWNPDRIRELCQMDATGVTPDAMSIAAELLVQKMQEHDVELAKRVKSYTARLEEASPSMTGTLCFSAVEERKRHDEPPHSPLHQKQSGSPATKQSKVALATAGLPHKRARLDASRELCSEPTCQRSHFRSTKWVTCPTCNKTFCPVHASNLRKHQCAPTSP